MKRKLIILKLIIVTSIGFLIAYLSPKVVPGLTKYGSDNEIESLHQPLKKALPGEWLSIVKEPGQTFEQYSNSNPNGKTKNRNKIYIRPIGNFSYTEKKVLKSTSEYLENFYELPVEILDSISIALIPKTSFRIHQGNRQTSAKYILNNLLASNIPNDAAAYIAFTKIDLYNEAKKNFVLGLGNLVNRSGVYSMARFGNPDNSDLAYKMFVSRTFKIASHELGHIFGVKHCIDYRCIMNGSNSLIESDSKPVYFCPIDLKKVCWNLKIDPAERFMKLKTFWSKNRFEENSNFYHKSEILINSNVLE
ncbi:hypothetical protein FEE95_07750 [Maribacter algarum]|uniref:Archaemetzincin n=1 Tax=Maribacter algarum (ex Zhang et al. 2020) TaxID=2578118 RepID=A0A5S3PWB5_9FLAO|nr:archaemetzincin [Maribacter algarum]TMM59316.1 hypothetical protein FEE95_07750 [Maribacter algarum]